MIKNYFHLTCFSISIAAFLFVVPYVSAQEIHEENSFKDVIILTVNEYSEDVSINDILSWFSITPHVRYTPTHNTEITNTNYCDQLHACALSQSRRQAFHTQKTTTLRFNEEDMRAFLEDLSRRSNVDPVNARFSVTGGRVQAFAQHKNGIALNIDESLKHLKDGLKDRSPDTKTTVALAYDTIEPEITQNSAKKLGIKELIGEGRSDFAGSTKDRIHNIRVAANRFNGVLVKPGEEFSFVEHLGPVDGEHGYKEELVIKDHQTKPEFGGGICQVSTTAFRGAILTGMKITARRNHSYPVKYYEPTGFDATIYLPAPDMRFKNNTPGYILLQTEMQGTELVFRYYGTKDGRTVKMDGPHVTEKNDDGSMKTYFVQKVVDRNGDDIISDTFHSNYKSPKDYPKPGDVSDTKLTEKPKDWSSKEWKKYKKTHGV